MSATNATPHASCSNRGSYRPCGAGDAGMPSDSIVAVSLIAARGCTGVPGRALGTRGALARDDIGPATEGYLSVTGPVGFKTPGCPAASYPETLVPIACPTPYTTATAIAPRTNCRSEPSHSERRVNFATAAPIPSRTIAASRIVQNRLVAPSRYGRT